MYSNHTDAIVMKLHGHVTHRDRWMCYACWCSS